MLVPVKSNLLTPQYDSNPEVYAPEAGNGRWTRKTATSNSSSIIDGRLSMRVGRWVNRKEELTADYQMSSEQRLMELCAQLLACEDDDTAIALAEQLRTILHDHVEEMRDKLKLLRTPASAA